MRLTSLLKIAGTAALVAAPVMADAAPLRAGSALPAASGISRVAAQRAATPVQDASGLAGFPVVGLIGILAVVTVIVVVASSGGGHSPG